MVLSAQNPLANKWYMLIVQGFVFFAIYYFVFRWAITTFKLKTPGREDDDVEDTSKSHGSENSAELAKQYLEVLGGHANLQNIDACITRLRLTVNNMDIIDESKLKALGAMGVVKLGNNNLQVILGR